MYFSPSMLALYDSPAVDDCKPITDLLHNELVAKIKLGEVLLADNSGNPYTEAVIYTPPPLTLNELFAVRIDNLDKDYEFASGYLRTGYPSSETATWTLQVMEAGRYKDWVDGGSVGPAPSVQFLTYLLVGRQQGGVEGDLLELVNRVIVNNNIYTPLLALMTGHRHAAEKALKLALSQNDRPGVEAITWDFIGLIPQPAQ